jgi:hypothetical protein
MLGHKPGSSVSIVCNYGLEDRANGIRSPAQARDFFSSLFGQNGSGAHPASCPMGTGVLSPAVKRGRGVTLTIQHYLVPRARMSRSVRPLPTSASMACGWTALYAKLVVDTSFNI